MFPLNKNTTDGTDKFVTTYYVRDPQGNVLAVYEHKHGDSDNGTFTLAEQHLYGASRLGMRKRDLALNTTNANETPATYYELTNHLGNVLAVISDKASDTNEPTVVSLSDYYPFGMTEPGRSWNAGDYRFGYTGHEKENDLADGVYTTEYRLLDTRLGRWMSVDPLAGDFAWMSPYNYCGGDPVRMVDPDGRAQCDSTGTLTIDFNPQVVIQTLNQFLADPNVDLPSRNQYQRFLDGGGFATWDNGQNYYMCGVARTDRGNSFMVMVNIFDLNPIMSSNCAGYALLGGQAATVSGNDIDIILRDEYIRKDCRATDNDVIVHRQWLVASNIPNPSTGKYPRATDANGNFVSISNHVALKIPNFKVRGVENEYVQFIHQTGVGQPTSSVNTHIGGVLSKYDNCVKATGWQRPRRQFMEEWVDTYQPRPNRVEPNRVIPYPNNVNIPQD